MRQPFAKSANGSSNKALPSMATTSAALSPNQLHILQHSLGADKHGRGTMYRNRFVTGPDADQWSDCRALVEMGYMESRGPIEAFGGMSVFSVTESGIDAMRDASPEPPKLSPAKRRYQEFLNADSGLTFREWLKARKNP
jgi:hypothetical protein